MKIAHILFLSFLFSFVALGQTSVDKLQLGDSYPFVNADMKRYFTEGNEILSVKIDGRRLVLQKFDGEKLTQASSNLYEDFPSAYSPEDVFKFRGKYYFFYSVWDKPVSADVLFYREIDFSKGAFVGEAKKLISLPKETTRFYCEISVNYFALINKYMFTISGDNNKLLIQYRPSYYDSMRPTKNEEMGMYMFDANFKVLWERRVTLPEDYFRVDSKFTIDEAGNVFFLAKKESQETNTDVLLLMKVQAQGGRFSFYPLNVKAAGNYIHGLWLYDTAFPYFMVGGFYSHTKAEYFTGADGIFLFKVRPDGSVFDQKSYEFPLEMINEYDKAGAQKRNAKAGEQLAQLDHLRMKEVIAEEDGSIFLTGEQFDININNGNYNYDNILAARISPEGKLLWMKKIPKGQFGKGDMSNMSFKLLQGSDNYYFAFLDNEKNANLSTTTAPKRHLNGQGGFLTVYQINKKTGDRTYHSMLDTKNVDGIEVGHFGLRRVVLLYPSTIVTDFYVGGKKDRIVKMDLK